MVQYNWWVQDYLVVGSPWFFSSLYCHDHPYHHHHLAEDNFDGVKSGVYEWRGEGTSIVTITIIAITITTITIITIILQKILTA